MRFASLGSGSEGNGLLVEVNGTRILADCGFGLADTVARLARLGVEAESIKGILVTHEHDDTVQSFVFTSDRPLDQGRLQAFFRDAMDSHAEDLMRYKGIAAFPGFDHRVVFQGVHMIMGSDIGRPWAANESRRSTLVFIGRNLPKEHWLERLVACRVD